MIYIFDQILNNKNAGGVATFTEILIAQASDDENVKLASLNSSSFFYKVKSRFITEIFSAREIYKCDKNAKFLFPNYYLPYFLPKIALKKSAVVIHDLQHIYMPENFSIFKKNWLDVCYRRVAKKAGMVVFISKVTRDEFIDNFGTPEKYEVIYNPVEIKNSSDGQDDSSCKYGQYLVASYHYYPHKNFEATLQLYGELRNLGYNGKLVITGSGKSKVMDLIEKYSLPLDDIYHEGFVERNRLIELYKKSDAFISLSKFEGFNLSAAEAVTLGVKLILSEIPVHKELFSDTAFLVDLKCIDAISVYRYLQSNQEKSEWFLKLRCKPSVCYSEYIRALDIL